MRVIQQWQYDGGVHPALLNDDAFLKCKDIGVTALQSYVTWTNIEPSRGRFDFSLYDPLFEKLEKHSLGWVPFLIAGPAYATPRWFHESPECVYYKCLEHGAECDIQSIWNPALKPRVAAFLSAFSARYGASRTLESIMVGPSGNWGESIYPASGGFTESKHMHIGWWCGDRHAIGSYRAWLADKYAGDIGALNSSWEAAYNAFDEVTMPRLDSASLNSAMLRVWYRFSVSLPEGVRRFLKSLLLRRMRNRRIEDNGASRQWLDFVTWYCWSMTDWMEHWLSVTRKANPGKPILVVTGGDGNPVMGANFFEQARAAAKYNAGFRVTNLSDHYDDSFAWSRPVISACRFYGVEFETEEALLHEPSGVVMRIFDASSSGASGIYMKNLIGYGRDLCTGNFYKPGEMTECGRIFRDNAHLLHKGTPVVDLAVFYPDTAVIFDFNALALLNAKCAALREHFYFELIDEAMIADGALEGCGAMVVFDDCHIPKAAALAMDKWVESGGILVHASSASVSKPRHAAKGKGHVLTLPRGGDVTGRIRDALENPDGRYPWPGRKHLFESARDVYTAHCLDGTYLYNQSGAPSIVHINGTSVEVMPHSFVIERHQ